MELLDKRIRADVRPHGAVARDDAAPGWIPKLVAKLYTARKVWAEAEGEIVGSIRRFSSNLATRGFEKWRQPGSSGRGFRGIALKSSASSTSAWTSEYDGP